jgi:hypothetical protein
MSIDDVGAVCWLHTTDGESKGYPSLQLGRAALRGLIIEQRRKGYAVEETKEHQWAIKRTGELGTMVVWLADEDTNVIPALIQS